MTIVSQPAAVRMSSCGRRILLTAAILIYLLQGLFFTRTLVSSEDEEAYLALGYLAVTGKISLYQDEMTGQRMPVPFYILGGSQLVFGRNLWAGRLLSLALGLGALGFTIAVGRQLHGEVAGFLAGFFLATQGAIVGYYATAAYHAMTAFILIVAVWVLLKKDLPWRYPLGMAVASILFFTRTNLFPALPFFFVWALVGARTLLERLAVVLVSVAPPAIFLLWDTTHLKLLAHVPVLDRLVEPMGYRSILYFQAAPQSDLGHQVWSLLLFARRYESWTLAIFGLMLASGIILLRGRQLATPTLGRTVPWVAGLSGWILLWHFIIFRYNFKWVIAYFPDFAPLAAALLGVGFAGLLTRQDLPRLARGALVAGLAAGLTVGVVFVRHPLMPTPIPRPFYGDPIQLLDRSAAQLGSLVSADTKVFLVGHAMPAYLAGLRPYIPQIMSPYTLTANDQDEWLVSRSGVWGRTEVERWLGREAGFALIAPQVLEALGRDRPMSVNRIQELLRERFVFVGRVGVAPWYVYDVYRRLDARGKQ